VKNISIAVIVGFSLLSVLGCGEIKPEVEFSAPEGSGEPNLYATPDGRVVMSWFERLPEEEWALKVAERANGVWSAAATVVERREFFVNWADFPAVSETSDGVWVVHWLEKVSAETFAYHVVASRSEDKGQTWSEPITVHEDRSPTEHGFVSHASLPDGEVQLIWLDGQHTSGVAHEGAMSLRSATLGADGAMHSEQLVDERICDCCQTAMIRLEDGTLVTAYRDRSEEEIRDIAVRRFAEGEWSEPVHVGDDNWHITACPVNGPSLSSNGGTVAIIWFSAPEGDSRVRVAFSEDGGAAFGEPVRIDGGTPLGRVDGEFLSDGSFLAVWLEVAGEDAEIRARQVYPSGEMGDFWTVAATSRVRPSGFPRVVALPGELLFAWTVAGDGGGVRVASAAVDF